jgi:molecular chaperone DnaJ
MTMLDYYEILGVDKSASAQDIKSAYRKLAKEWHPDVHQGDKAEAEIRFKKINEAYAALGDEQARATYDEGQNPHYAWAPNGSRWESFFNHRNPFDSKHPQSINAVMEISLREAVTGIARDVAFECRQTCSHCSGTGAAEGVLHNCGHCGGSGQVHQTTPLWNVVFSQAVLCPYCSGSGKRPEKACTHCTGTGSVPKAQKISISIPPGVDTNNMLRVAGMGHHGSDLNIIIRVRDDPVFQRQGQNLYRTVEIPFLVALSGGDAQTLNIVDDKVTIKVPKACEYGSQILVPGHGVCGGALGVKIVYKLPDLQDEDVSKIRSILKS